MDIDYFPYNEPTYKGKIIFPSEDKTIKKTDDKEKKIIVILKNKNE